MSDKIYDPKWDMARIEDAIKFHYWRGYKDAANLFFMIGMFVGMLFMYWEMR